MCVMLLLDAQNLVVAALRALPKSSCSALTRQVCSAIGSERNKDLLTMQDECLDAVRHRSCRFPFQHGKPRQITEERRLGVANH